MSDQITFYYNPRSRGRVVHWMLEECGADYETKILEWERADHKSPAYLKINPMGKIPTIVHKGVVVTETAAICLYLADIFPKAGLAPEVGDPRRGTYYRWFMFSLNCVDQALMDRKYPRIESQPSSVLGYGTYEATMSTLEQVIGNGYILGDRFSAADLYIASQLGYGMRMMGLKPTPVIEKYMKLCTSRPGFQRYLEKAGPM